MIEDILERYRDGDIIKADGLDNAIVGFDEKSYRLIYSISKCIKELEKDMPYEEASEFFFFNTYGAYIENGPIFMDDDF